MKTYKPYLSLIKNTDKYELGVIVNAVKNQTITGIRQEEVKNGKETCWGVIISLSDSVSMVNGPENPIFSVTVDINVDRAVYKKIMCCTEISVPKGKLGSTIKNTTVDFGDATT